MDGTLRISWRGKYCESQVALGRKVARDRFGSSGDHRAMLSKSLRSKPDKRRLARRSTEVIVVTGDNFFDRLGFGTGHTGGRQELKADADLDGLSKERKRFGIF